MHLGAAIFLTDRTPAPDRLARELEDRGFESLWVPEHTHMPVDHSPYPGGGDLPEPYHRQLDPFVALAVAAAATTRIRLATGVCLVAQHDAIALAKAVATLDLLSGGRFTFGVGYGWNRPEVEDHGVPFAHRRDAVRERVLAMRALWTEEVASFDGEWVRFGPTWSWPKPVQQPHPPIVIGASPGPMTFAHLAEFADGWLPIGKREATTIPAMRAAVEAAGRDPDTIAVTVYGTRPEPGVLDQLRELGVERVVLWLPSAGEAEVMGEVERFTGLLEVVESSSSAAVGRGS